MLEESAIKKIIKLILTGMSLNMIAKELKVSRASVKYHCIKNNLGGVIAHNPLVDEAYEKFINGFNKRHSKGFIYVSGFMNSESSVLIRCKQCGKEFKRSAQIARKDKKLTCGYCKTLDIERRLQEKEIERKVEQETRKKNREQLLVRKQQKREQSLITLCQVCGNTFKGSRLGLKYCSEECKKKHNNRAKELKRRKRIALNGEIDSDISLERLIKKECNVCYICKGECDINDYTITNEGHFVVGSNYPSIEHVIPISKGGKHTWDNIKLAHHYCNTIKSNKEIKKVKNE